jgi:hypothetical protein
LFAGEGELPKDKRENNAREHYNVTESIAGELTGFVRRKLGT